MSDQKLRELERRWRESGSVEDEAAYLRERVRVGDLTQERLELAAYCGHEGARQALGEAVPQECANDRWQVFGIAGPRLQAVLRWLEGVPNTTLAAVALELTRESLGIWERRERGHVPHDLVRLASEMLAAPTPTGLSGLAQRCAAEQERAEYDVPPPASRVLLGASEVGQAIARGGDPELARQAIFSAILGWGEDALMPSFPFDTDPADAPETPELEACLAAIEDSAPGLLERLQKSLIGWALDDSDSVRPKVLGN